MVWEEKMKKTTIKLGCVGAVVFLVLAMFPAVINAQTTFKSNEMKSLENNEKVSQPLEEIKITNERASTRFSWYPGLILGII